ncbi:hypothetical protein KCU81_g499, partial [Aureobasidium melanogenum]
MGHQALAAIHDDAILFKATWCRSTLDPRTLGLPRQSETELGGGLAGQPRGTASTFMALPSTSSPINPFTLVALTLLYALR